MLQYLIKKKNLSVFEKNLILYKVNTIKMAWIKKRKTIIDINNTSMCFDKKGQKIQISNLATLMMISVYVFIKTISSSKHLVTFVALIWCLASECSHMQKIANDLLFNPDNYGHSHRKWNFCKFLLKCIFCNNMKVYYVILVIRI